MYLEDARLCKASFEGEADLCGICPGLGGKGQCLGDCPMVSATMILLAALAVCPSPTPPIKRNILTHRLQDRQGYSEINS